MRVTPLPDSAHPDTAHHGAADLPMSFLREERRLAGRALQSWRRHQRAAVPGFEATSLTVADPGGEAMVLAAAPALQSTFALAVGQSLARNAAPQNTLAAELCAACDLVALGGRPIPFEASLNTPGGSMVLVRGIVLPLINPRHDIDTVQVVLSWREVLNRSATSRLRRELGAALRSLSADSGFAAGPARASRDPFPITAPPRTPMLSNKHK